MKQIRSIVLGLLPPGSIIASIQRYQERIFRETGNASALGVLPLLPLRSYSRPVAPPKELRLNEPLAFSPPVEYRSSMYLPLENANALDSLTEKLSLGYAPTGEDEMLLFPVFPGIFLCRGGIPPLSAGIVPGKELLRSASFSAVLMEYRCSLPRGDWWDSIEERIHWEIPVRKPQKKLNRGTE
jgi:hypothetical protein